MVWTFLLWQQEDYLDCIMEMRIVSIEFIQSFLISVNYCSQDQFWREYVWKNADNVQTMESMSLLPEQDITAFTTIGTPIAKNCCSIESIQEALMSVDSFFCSQM